MQRQGIMKLGLISAVFFTLVSSISFAAESKRPTVVELFTAQGCPSCPKADTMLKEISAHPEYLPLSYHVTYFDNEGWKDPYSSVENNLRQRRYLMAVGIKEAFTPHFVVDGTISSAGSDAKSFVQAIKESQNIALSFPLSATYNPNTNGLDVVIGDDTHQIPPDSVLYEVHFKKSVTTSIRGGGNDGITTENVNNVLSFFKMPLSPRYFVPVSRLTGDGVAYLLHNNEGRIMGSAYYIKP